MAGYLSRDDRIALTSALSGLYDLVQGSIERRNLLKGAGLDRFLTGLPLGDGVDPSRFSQSLVNRLEDYGPLPEDPRYEALGMLLSYLLGRDDIPPQTLALFATLTVRYDMVKDPDYIGGLRKQFKIEEPPLRQAPGASSRPSPIVSAPAPSPSLPEIQLDAPALEQIINSKDNFLEVTQLIGAIYSARAVCLIQSPKGEARGTGFLIGPDLLLTNCHVLPRSEHLGNAVALFDYVSALNGVPSAGREFQFRTDFFHCSPQDQLDYALTRLESAPFPELSKEDREGGAGLLDLFRRGKHRGYLLVAPEFIREGQRVNIIQHPAGGTMKAVLTQNHVPLDMTDQRVQYVADTMAGSSGSPIFNASWEVIALHHSGEPYPPESVKQQTKKAWKGVFRVNEGIPMRAILNDLKDKKLDRFLRFD